MTNRDRETREASQRADEALERAERTASRSVEIAKAWQDSRQQNNFRAMIRGLGTKAAGHGST